MRRRGLWWWVYGLGLTVGLTLILGNAPSFTVQFLVTVLVGSLGGFIIGIVGALRKTDDG